MSIPIHLVTGFLGSGKTSFLKHFLDNRKQNDKIAIIQNEFSPVGMDGRKLHQTDEYEILEINNGSVFCVCLLGSFIESLLVFIEQVKPDTLIMETSGLSDTIGVGQIFQSEKLKGKVYLEHIWCLVDACNYDRIPSLKQRFQHQLRTADSIIINKTDLVEGKTDPIISSIKKINPFARVLTSQFGKVELAPAKRALNLFPSGDNQPLGRPDIESVVIRSSREISEENLRSFLNEYPSIRSKGFVKLKQGKSAFMQGVFSDIQIEEVQSFSGPSEFVLIGEFKKTGNLQVVFEEYCRK